MRDTDTLERIRAHASAWVVDYSAARAKALAWLGNRYLLAQPVRRKSAADQMRSRRQADGADRHSHAA
jgi:hypothetical protein